MYLSFEPNFFSLLQSADSQSTKWRVSEHMVDPVDPNSFGLVSIWKAVHGMSNMGYSKTVKWANVSEE